MEDSHINITLISQKVSKDMRIPTQIEVRRLIRELDKISGQSGQRSKYQLLVRNKGIVLDEGKRLADYPITTGDVIVIEEDE